MKKPPPDSAPAKPIAPTLKEKMAAMIDKAVALVRAACDSTELSKVADEIGVHPRTVTTWYDGIHKPTRFMARRIIDVLERKT